MSTKTSADMHVDRSSTRRHAPPGGNTSISFGWEDKAKAPVPVAVAAPEIVTEEGIVSGVTSPYRNICICSKRVCNRNC